LPSAPCLPSAPRAPRGPSGPAGPAAPALPGLPCFPSLPGGPRYPCTPGSPGGPCLPFPPTLPCAASCHQGGNPCGPEGSEWPRGEWRMRACTALGTARSVPTFPGLPGPPTAPSGPPAPAAPTGPACEREQNTELGNGTPTAKEGPLAAHARMPHAAFVGAAWRGAGGSPGETPSQPGRERRSGRSCRFRRCRRAGRRLPLCLHAPRCSLSLAHKRRTLPMTGAWTTEPDAVHSAKGGVLGVAGRAIRGACTAPAEGCVGTVSAAMCLAASQTHTGAGGRSVSRAYVDLTECTATRS
jgi:hypothetical protein